VGKPGARLQLLPCLDSEEMAASRRDELDIPWRRAAELGRTAVEATDMGYYLDRAGRQVDWSAEVSNACAAKKSVPPDAPLGNAREGRGAGARVQVSNETTLQAGRRLVGQGLQPLALNFANGLHPGGGFLNGARAQEEVLCRSSALWRTLVGDPMYEHHGRRPLPDSTDWVIYSPGVPIFRTDDGAPPPSLPDNLANYGIVLPNVVSLN